MFFKSIRFLYNWFLFLLTIVSIGAMLFYFYKVSDYVYSLNDSMKDKIELASWIFAGIMGLVSFLSLFIAFVYDNKHIEASRILRQYYKPYGLRYETMRLSLNEYSTYVSKGFMLNVIYLLLSFTSIVSIILWGVSVNVFTEHSLNFNLWWSKEDILSLGLYLFWLILSLLLVGILAFVNIIRLNKDPVGKGFLPDYDSIRNVDFLVDKDADIGEIIFVSSPRLDIYRYENKNKDDSFELNVFFPIKLINMKYMFKVYNNDRLIFRCFGLILDEIANEDRLLLRDDTSITPKIYERLADNTHAELKIYDSKNSILGRLKLLGNMQNNNISFVIERRILNQSGIDIDKGIVEALQKNNGLNIQEEPL